MVKTLIGFLTGIMVGATGIFGGAIAVNHYFAGKPKISHHLNGYYITKKESNGTKTVYSYEEQILWKGATERLYLGLGNNNRFDDMILVDNNCDGKIDAIQDSTGITIRATTKLEELLNIRIGTKEAFDKADALMEKYKQEFTRYVAEAEKDRLIMMGFD